MWIIEWINGHLNIKKSIRKREKNEHLENDKNVRVKILIVALILKQFTPPS